MMVGLQESTSSASTIESRRGEGSTMKKSCGRQDRLSSKVVPSEVRLATFW